MITTMLILIVLVVFANDFYNAGYRAATADIGLVRKAGEEEKGI